MVFFPKMVDMANTPKEAKEDQPQPKTGEYKGPKYPYGLAITLSDDQLEKLDLDDDCEVGDELNVFASARVTSKSETTDSDGKKCCRIELQIEQLALDDNDDDDKEDKASKRYSGSKGDE